MGIYFDFCLMDLGYHCHYQPDNQNAIGFYKKMGGVIVDRDEGNEERWQDSVIFEFLVQGSERK